MFDRDAALDATSQGCRAGLGAVHASVDTAMEDVRRVTTSHGRAAWIATSARRMRVDLAATVEGVALHPPSQALRDDPEMAAPCRTVHEGLAPGVARSRCSRADLLRRLLDDRA